MICINTFSTKEINSWFVRIENISPNMFIFLTLFCQVEYFSMDLKLSIFVLWLLNFALYSERS
jgi:hypothetical protein